MNTHLNQMNANNQSNPQSVHGAIEALNNAFDEFKAANDQRLAHLETKGRPDQGLEQRVNHLNDVVNQLEAAAHRPFLDGSSALDRNDGSSYGSSGHKSAFLSYLTKGDLTALRAFEEKSLSSANDASGGYLIPKTILEKIHSHMAVTSPMRSVARVHTISTDTYELLIEKGQAEVGWVSEIGERKETGTPELMKVRIPVHQIYAKPHVSQKLLDDSSVSVEDWLAEKIAEKMTLEENAAFISGDGNGKPKGFLVYERASLGQGSWGKIEHILSGENGGLSDADVILEACHALKAQYISGAKWMMSRSALATIRKLKDKAGAYLWQPSLSGAAPGLLAGYPVIVADDMPALSEGQKSTPIAFGNFREGYQIVDRAGLHILRDPFSAKPYVEFYATKRVGGDVINFDALKLITCAAE